jgi:signal transduction histidine kinase
MSPPDLAGAVVTASPQPLASEDARLRRRLERERRARLEAEAISEVTTRQLYDRQQGLRLLQEVAAAANGATSVDVAMQEALDRVCEFTGWPMGHVYLRDPSGKAELVPTRIWSIDEPDRFAAFRELTEKTVFASGVGLPGRVLASGKPVWLEDVRGDGNNFPRLKVTGDLGVRAAFGAPVLVEAEVAGVLEFLTDIAVEPDESLLEIMLYVGTQLGRVVERKRAEEELQTHRDHLEELVAERTAALTVAYQELEGFSYSVSHDLRAPLRSMDGFSQALLEDYEERLDAEGVDYLRRIRASSQRMAGLIDDLLLLSRVARSEIERTSVDMSALAELVAAELREHDPEREVTVAIEPSVRVYADEPLLRVVLENLLGNAWKFTSGHPAAKIELGSIDDAGELAYFVRDDGAGFDMAFADKLFGAFQRLHSTSEFEGSGVGLATVQRIVHRHGGRVWAEAEVEGGATVYFTIPSTRED